MEMRDELLRFAVEEFADNLPDEVNSEEFAWIIFNMLGYRGKIENWQEINILTTVAIGEFLVSQVVDQAKHGQIIRDAVKDADDFMGKFRNDV